MKDEEMAEESFKKYRTTDEDYEELNGGEKLLVFNHEYGAEKQYHRLYKQGFLAGLKAGRPQWHKVADGDLPKEDIYLVIRLNDKNTCYKYCAGFWEKEEKCFHTLFCDKVDAKDIIAWCEIPTFDKE